MSRIVVCLQHYAMEREQYIIYSETTSLLVKTTTEFARSIHQLCTGWKHRNAYEEKSLLQLYRAATSVAANSREARYAESRKDFIHKLKIAEKELAEFYFWFGLVGRNRGDWPDSMVHEIEEQARYIRNILRKTVQSARSSQA